MGVGHAGKPGLCGVGAESQVFSSLGPDEGLHSQPQPTPEVSWTWVALVPQHGASASKRSQHFFEQVAAGPARRVAPPIAVVARQTATRSQWTTKVFTPALSIARLGANAQGLPNRLSWRCG